MLCINWRENMELSTTTEMAEKWNISRRRVTTLCREGRIEGAILRGNTWLIPEDTKKPEDPRRLHKSGTN
jgi:DNA (cytosine-5)-methyltransferase 1